MKQFRQQRYDKKPFVIIGSNIGHVAHTKELKQSLDALSMPSKMIDGVFEMESGETINQKSFVVPYSTKKEYIMLDNLHYQKMN